MEPDGVPLSREFVKLSLNIKEGIIEECLIETIGCSV